MAKSKPNILDDLLGKQDAGENGPEAVRQNYYLTRELVARVRSFGKRRGLSASTIVKLALADYLEKNGG